MKVFLSLKILALILILIPVQVLATTMINPAMISQVDDIIGIDLEESEEALGFYHYFTDDGMSEAYTHAFGAMFNIVGWDRGRSEIRGGSGLWFASGTPLQLSQDWDVKSSSLGTVVLPLGGTYMYRLSEGAEGSLIPYVGIGANWLVGFERIAAHVVREQMGGDANFEWHDTSFRHSFAAHVAFGSHKKVTERFSFVAEIRYSHGGKGRLKRRELTDEEITQGWGDVFRDFQHPNYKFSGFNALIGLRW